MKRVAGIFLLSLCTMCFVSCNDDDTPDDPADTIALNMFSEHNGKIYLGESKTYINEANSFVTSSNFISDIRNGTGVGADILSSLTSFTHEVAITPGHIYQTFDRNTPIDFLSGNHAIQVEVSYYQTYTVFKVVDSDMAIGAVARYISVFPNNNGLPVYRYGIGGLRRIGETVELTLPQNVKFFLEEYSVREKELNVTSANNKLGITLTKASNIVNGPYGTFNLYIRSNNISTVIEVYVE